MIKKAVLGTLMFATTTVFAAKEKNGVIMTVDGEDVPTEEFLYLYEKNNQQQSQHQSLDDYLQLFEIYRLKVAEAKSQGVDTLPSFQKEISLYKKELLEPYILDTVFFNKLVDVASEREKSRVESSHIMMIRTHNEERDQRNLQILDSLRNEILNGADFIEIAKNYSQDKFSSAKGGYLGFAPAGTYPYGFETAVYETPEGEISEIVESHVGWHIVKSGSRKPAEEFNKEMKTYEEVKADVMRKSTSPFDPRFHQLRKNTIDKLSKKHPELVLTGLTDDEIYNTLIEAEGSLEYTQNPEYRNLVDEYVNGSLLYEVSVENVWNKAANDNEGLENFYNRNKSQYRWETPHAKGYLVQTKNDSIANEIKNVIGGELDEAMVVDLKKRFKNEAIIEKFNVSQGTNPMVDNLMFGGAPAKPKFKNFDTYFILEGRIVDEPEELDDVRPAVINDYQEELENIWVGELKQKHKIVVNNKELNKLKKLM